MANYEQLFLLEVLVDRIKLLTRTLAAFAPESEDEADTPIRIRVKFSDFPCFEITQDLATGDKEQQNSDELTTPVVFNSGKSCMFPMDPAQLLQDLVKYPMAVTIFKKNPENPLPDIIGQTKVPLGEYMTNIIKRAAEWSLEEPLSELIQDTFPLRNAQDQDVGTISMLIRLTCFGKTIITKFQIADNKKSFLFKNAKTQDYEFKCKKCMPGQPILRPQPKESNQFEEEEEEEEEEDNCNRDWNQEGMAGDAEPDLPCVEKEEVPTRRSSNRDTYSQGPGFQRHEIQGPGFTASMEVRYPENGDNGYDSGYNYNRPTESQSTPTVKRSEKGTKDKRGKSLDMEKVDIKKGVSLEKPRKKRKNKYHVKPQITYPGVILGHKYCVNQGPPVPARNGWAWKTTVPYGMKWEDVRGWRPGCFLKQTWATMKEVEEIRKMGKRKRVKRKPLLPDMRKTTVHIHRIKGVYHVTMHPVQGPEDKHPPEPVVYTVDNTGDGSDASELELDLTVPDAPYPPPPDLKHQAQQFCEEDLPLILPKPVLIKPRKKKKKPKPPAPDNKKKKKKKKGKPSSAKSGASEGKTSKAASQTAEKGGKGGKEDKGKAGAKGGKEDKGKAGTKGGKEDKGKTGAKGGKEEKGKAGAKGGKEDKGKAGAKAGGKPDKAQPGKTDKGGKAAVQSSGAKGKKTSSKRKKGDEDDDVYPWDEWIMKLKCRNKHSPDD